MKHIFFFIFTALLNSHSFVAMDKATVITITEDTEITSYNLCAATDMAATSTVNKRVKIWTLNWRTPAAKLITILQEEHPVKFVCFNDTGSQLATLMQPKENEIQIKIWNPKDLALLYNFTSSFHNCKPHNLYYSHGTKHPLLCMEHSDDKGCNAHMWSCKNDEAVYRGCIVAGNYYSQMPHYWPTSPQTHRDNSKKAGIERYESDHPLDYSNYLLPYRDNKKIVITLLGSIIQKSKDD